MKLITALATVFVVAIVSTPVLGQQGKRQGPPKDFTPQGYTDIQNDPTGAKAAERGLVAHKRTVGENPAPGFALKQGSPGEEGCKWINDRTLRCPNSYVPKEAPAK